MIFDIILPTIGRDSLEKTVESVLAQTYQDWRLHIVGDGIDPQEFTDWRIRHHRIERAEGYGASARNEGIARSGQEWIAYIDDDDTWLPHHLQTMVNLKGDNGSVNMLKTAGQEFRMKHRHPRSSKKVPKLGPINTRDHLTVGMAHTRGIFNKTNGWQPHDNHDHTLWRDMALAGGHYATADTVTFHFLR